MRKTKGKRDAHRAARKPSGAGEILEVHIERILPGGAGLAHAEGRTILVGLAAPGDHLRVRLEQARGNVSFAKIVEILTPSPVRVLPPCPYFGRCGGCDFQQLSYEAQLAAKVEIIRDCLRRIARIEPPGDIPITPSPLNWRYRSRAQWQYDPITHSLGYFERGSHKVCDVLECPVLVPALQETLLDLRARLKEGSLPAEVREFQSVAGDEGASLLPPLTGGQTREVTRRIAGENYRFNAAGFFQINHELLAPLVNAALTDAHGEMAHGATAVDLYCGAGLFTLPLARRFTRVTGVEASAHAVAYARRNLSDAGLTNASVHSATVSSWLKEHGPALAPVDYLLLDPPRTGAEEGAIAGILLSRPQRIAYVSCDPATLARDLKQLLSGGYHLDTITAFDMFPQTHHVETVTHLAVLL
ncbi:MAG TPA: class I SAM-dependent RNA methyltransferase [Pyrinomonadaceae bacterium]|jgi:23S rRNA (uracil1939-C5)-methyltransferase|nr:class I SAM-dependent RNA methyltransferase [Pyrinomonadaceae bacterium]